MNIIKRFFARLFPGGHSYGDGTETVRISHIGKTTAGVSINADTALKNATVWACISYLGRTVGQLPWRVMQETQKGAARAPMDPRDYLLKTRPNPEMSSFAFRETMVGWAARWGNAVAEIQWDRRGVPVALWPIHPSRVSFEREKDTGELLFGISRDDGSKDYLKGEDVFHVRGFGEGAIGLDVVAYAAESIGWAQATELFGASFFGNGANISGFLQVPGRLTLDGKRAIDDEIREKHAGPKKGNKVMLVDQGMKFEKSGVAPDEAQFNETMQYQVEQICRWFGVPPHKVMHLLRATFSNIEHQSIEVVQDSIAPWCKRFEDEADYKLFAARSPFFTKLDLKGLLRGDFKSRQEGLQIMRRNGVINANFWCRLEDMDEIGPEGDVYIVEGNMTTLDQVGKVQPTAATMRPPAANEEETDDDTPSNVKTARRQAARALH